MLAERCDFEFGAGCVRDIPSLHGESVTLFKDDAAVALRDDVSAKMLGRRKVSNITIHPIAQIGLLSVYPRTKEQEKPTQDSLHGPKLAQT